MICKEHGWRQKKRDSNRGYYDERYIVFSEETQKVVHQGELIQGSPPCK